MAKLFIIFFGTRQYFKVKPEKIRRLPDIHDIKFNKISYNWRIIMAPDHIVDYLIVHELSHIIEPNHSKNFWYQVGNYCKDFQKKRKWLRENGHKLVL